MTLGIDHSFPRRHSGSKRASASIRYFPWPRPPRHVWSPGQRRRHPHRHPLTLLTLTRWFTWQPFGAPGVLFVASPARPRDGRLWFVRASGVRRRSRSSAFGPTARWPDAARIGPPYRRRRGRAYLTLGARQLRPTARNPPTPRQGPERRCGRSPRSRGTSRPATPAHLRGAQRSYPRCSSAYVGAHIHQVGVRAHQTTSG